MIAYFQNNLILPYFLFYSYEENINLHFYFLFSREITNLSILKSFIHLRYLDISKNNLKDISPLSALTHMLTLKADQNLLTSARMEEMPFLQVASFNFNKITTLEGMSHPVLEQLSVNSKLNFFDKKFNFHRAKLFSN